MGERAVIAAAETKLTPWFERRSRPQRTRYCVEEAPPFNSAPSLAMRLSSSSKTVSWHTAPRSESSSEPASPATRPTAGSTTSSRLDATNPPEPPRASPPSAWTRPMKAPPAAEASVPSAVTPPLVPAGTRRHGAVTSRGGCRDNAPSSEAHVSPAQHAKNPTKPATRSSQVMSVFPKTVPVQRDQSSNCAGASSPQRTRRAIATTAAISEHARTCAAVRSPASVAFASRRIFRAAPTLVSLEPVW
mmetsp:Transcript_21152/g.84303  ORF Transcript_21152/g.84303 Transcript_21152/m.84303 type:complete len:246 (+) Transcript_21152:43-780(+)